MCQVYDSSLQCCCMAKSNTARQSVSLSLWAWLAGRLEATWLVPDFVPCPCGWVETAPQMLSLAGLALILDPCKSKGRKAPRQEGFWASAACEKGKESLWRIALCGGSKLFWLSVCYGERTVQPHFDRPVPCPSHLSTSPRFDDW